MKRISFAVLPAAMVPLAQMELARAGVSDLTAGAVVGVLLGLSLVGLLGLRRRSCSV